MRRPRKQLLILLLFASLIGGYVAYRAWADEQVDERLLRDLSDTTKSNISKDAVERLRLCRSNCKQALPGILNAVQQNPRVAPGVMSILDEYVPDWTKEAKAKSIADKFLKQAHADHEQRIGQNAFLAKIPPPDAVERLLQDVANVRNHSADRLQLLDELQPGWTQQDATRANIPKWLRWLGSPKAPQFAEAKAILDHVEPNWRTSEEVANRAVPVLFPQAISDNLRERETALAALNHLDAKWKDHAFVLEKIPAILKAAQPPPNALGANNSRAAALGILRRYDTLWAVRVGTSVAKPVLLKLLLSPDSGIMTSSVAALDHLEPGWRTTQLAREQLPKLFQMISQFAPGTQNVNETRNLHTTAMALIESIQPKIESADLPLYQQLLRSPTLFPNPELRLFAIRRVSTLGDAAVSAVPDLIQCLATAPSLEVQAAGLELLGKLDPLWKDRVELSAEKSSPYQRLVMLQLMKPDDASREAAVQLLDKLTPKWERSVTAKELVTELIERFTDGDTKDKFGVLRVFARLGTTSTPALVLLRKYSNAADKSLRDAVRTTILAIESDAAKPK